MKIKIIYLIAALALVFVSSVNAQTYTPNVSKDSLKVLKDRMDVLKASLKVNELKIKEFEEEVDVEKLRVKLLKANEKAKESAVKNSELSKKLSTGVLEKKEVEKMANRAKNDMADSQKALESYKKQITRVESIRSTIGIEEGKIRAVKPRVIFENK